MVPRIANKWRLLRRQPLHDADRISVVLMAAACGIADAVGFVHTGVFAANMTGNTVLAGLSLANQEWATALGQVVTWRHSSLGR